MADDDRRTSLEDVVRHVVPALGLVPGSLEIPRGAVARAERGRRAAVVALGGMEYQLVVLHPILPDRPDPRAIRRLGDEGLAALPDAARRACTGLVVAWRVSPSAFRAAAFTSPEGEHTGDSIASSWVEPGDWPTPMFDIGDPAEESLAGALERVRGAVAIAGVSEARRTTDLVNRILEHHRGERVDVDPPSAWAPAEVWASWSARYEQSVRAEWRRATTAPEGRTTSPAPGPMVTGPLTGLRVFVSYARPEASTMGWPVTDALSGAGATVWIDQTENPTADQLDEGLAEIIARCDAYVLCASNEFFERAGYGTQEVAWALAGGDRDSERRFVAVVRPETVLPRQVSDWARVQLDGLSAQALEAEVVEALTTARPTTGRAVPPTVALAPVPVRLPPWADLPLMRMRARHVRRFDAISEDEVVGIAVGNASTRSSATTRDLLVRVGEGLDWDGTMTGLDDWPADPLVRDMRWRLGTMRVLASVRSPLAGWGNESPDITDDLDHLLRTPLPPLDWPPAVGWSDHERRLCLRSHAGLLRLLDELLARGLTAGLPNARGPAQWERALRTRRQECLDALIDLRLAGRLDWQREPPLWDGVFRHISRWLLRSDAADWSARIPNQVLDLVLSTIEEVAALVAQVTWLASRTGEVVAQEFTPRRAPGVTVQAFAGGNVRAPAGSALQIGLVPTPNGRTEVWLAWSAFDAPAGSGVVTGTPPRLDELVSLPVPGAPRGYTRRR